ncbi:hypothetical protein EON65_55435 [archaeon]|nr:MAG: hypothetical protein EON65_55435 [archaeon]
MQGTSGQCMVRRGSQKDSDTNHCAHVLESELAQQELLAEAKTTSLQACLDAKDDDIEGNSIDGL